MRRCIPPHSRFCFSRALPFLLASAIPGCYDLDPVEAPTATPVFDRTPDHGPASFIVVLQPAADPEAVAQAHGLTPRFVYRQALHGFAGRISDAARAGLLRDARVRRVLPDATVSTTELQQAPA